MSNTKDWFQEVYSNNKGTIKKLTKIAAERDMTLRLSIHPDGEVFFTASNEEVLKTIINNSKTISYTKYCLEEGE
jgi:hypothetical protein